jgi:hypothetical protein
MAFRMAATAAMPSPICANTPLSHRENASITAPKIGFVGHTVILEPDRQGVLALADHPGGEDWWDKHRLGYGVVTTVASLQHWASRLKMVASVAKCLLGERSLQFFRFRGPRCVGQRDLFPFAILYRELPVDRHEELIRRAMRWPDPLADQIARVLKR